MQSPQELTYRITEKHFVAVVNFHGPLTKRSISVIEKCGEDLGLRNINWVILNFQDVTKMEFVVGPEFARLQHKVREKVVGLRLCSLNQQAKSLMEEAALIRPGEVYRNLNDAMKSLPVSRALDVGAI